MSNSFLHLVVVEVVSLQHLVLQRSAELIVQVRCRLSRNFRSFNSGDNLFPIVVELVLLDEGVLAEEGRRSDPALVCVCNRFPSA